MGKLSVRAIAARVLHRCSRILVIAVLTLISTLLVAGTFTVQNPERPATLALGLSDLAIVSVCQYDGSGLPLMLAALRRNLSGG